MTLRSNPGGVGTESPRLKDTPRLSAAAERTEGRDASGRFAVGNCEQRHKGIKRQIRQSLGDVNSSNSQLVKDALRLYFAMVRELPSDGAAVRSLCAASAKHSVLAGHLSNLALDSGLATDDGLKLSDAARGHDLAAQRLQVTAYDRAVREHKSKPKESTRDALTRRIFALNGKGPDGK
jgi:hypothetical protein